MSISKAKKSKKQKIIETKNIDELLDVQYGKIGSKTRDQFEEKAQYFVISEMLKVARMITTEFNVSAKEVRVENFELGLIKEKSIDAVQFDMNKIKQLVNRDIDGLIGTQIISDYNLMIDYDHNKVVFISDRSDLKVFDPSVYIISKAPIVINDGKSFIQMNIAGHKLNMLMDSGANISVLDQKWSKRLRVQQNLTSQMQDDFIIQQSSVNNVSISNLGITYRNLEGFQNESNYDGILSLSSLNADKVIFDYKRNQVIFFWKTEDFASLD